MQYVLIKHEKGENFHVDFLLDCGAERLLSWQLCDEKFIKSLVSGVKFFILAEQPKQITHTIDFVCRRIFDHRKRYLDYEGEIDENRGRVICVERGEWELSAINERQLTLKTMGRHITDKTLNVKAWLFEPPKGLEIDMQSPPQCHLMQRLPPAGEADWHIRCRFP